MKHICIAAFALALAACNPGAGTSSPASADHPRSVPPFDQRQFNTRCVAVAARTDTDPMVLASDKRTCACLERTLRPADFAMLLDFTEIDPKKDEHGTQSAELYRRWGMSDPQFHTELKRIQAQGRQCLTHH